MPIDDILKHPPVTEVQITVAFSNNFAVADQRSRFYDKVRAEFPIIVIPEQSKMAYDLADYILQRQDTADRIEVGMNYLRLASTRYPGFRKFRNLFIETFNIFLQCYEIKYFTFLSMYYRNFLPLEAHQKYKDVFALTVNIPESEAPELFAGQGVLVFQKPQGFLTVQLEPKAEEGMQVKSYSMNLLFTTLPDNPPFEKTLVADHLDTAHEYLKRFFFEVLTKQYIEYLRAK